jgi:hypothetical protein
MKQHIAELPSKFIHKLYYGLYGARLDLGVDYVLETEGPAKHWFDDKENRLYKYKSLGAPLRSIFEGIDYVPPAYMDFKGYPGQTLVTTLKNQCGDLIDFYHDLPKYQTWIGKSYWSIDPNYIRIDATIVSASVKFKFYFKDVDDLDSFYQILNQDGHLKTFRYCQKHFLNKKAQELINGDKYTTVVKKLPYNKYTSKLWLNYSRLRRMSTVEKLNALRVLEAYQEQGLVKCQPTLVKFLNGYNKFLWTDPYIYAEEASIKNMLDLVLVNIITRQERIVLENG